MDCLAKASEIFVDNVSEFKKACQLYKSMLDKNYGDRFCLGSHCRTIFMVEIRYEDSRWGATPKIFDSEEEAEKEAETLKIKYPFIYECRVITRKIDEEKRREEKRREETNP